MTDFETVWQRVLAFPGHTFRIKTGLPFTYAIVGASVVPDRTGYPLHVSQFRIAF